MREKTVPTNSAAELFNALLFDASIRAAGVWINNRPVGEGDAGQSQKNILLSADLLKREPLRRHHNSIRRAAAGATTTVAPRSAADVKTALYIHDAVQHLLGA
jgi:hypothetical protein